MDDSLKLVTTVALPLAIPSNKTGSCHSITVVGHRSHLHPRILGSYHIRFDDIFIIAGTLFEMVS